MYIQRYVDRHGFYTSLLLATGEIRLKIRSVNSRPPGSSLAEYSTRYALITRSTVYEHR